MEDAQETGPRLEPVLPGPARVDKMVPMGTPPGFVQNKTGAIHVFTQYRMCYMIVSEERKI